MAKRTAAFLTAGIVAALCACGGSGGPPAGPSPTATATISTPPNVVLIVADDLGWGDLSSYWPSRVATPRLDALAASGARLTDFYDTAPVCAPARASIMTGRWPMRSHIQWVVEPPYPLPLSEITIGRALHDQGYATALFGKWHLGPAPDFAPIHYGFDTYFGLPEETAPSFIEGDQPTAAVSYENLSQVYLDRSKAFIDANLTHPFLLVLPTRIPHKPLIPATAFAGKSGLGRYSDTVLELDWFVGAILDALDARGLTKNTVVVFTSDNGPVGDPEAGSTGPFTGTKQSLSEGGIRVPAIVSWPGHVPAGRVIAEPMSTLDLLPTFVHWAGGTLPNDRPYDGNDVSALLTGAVSKLPDRDIIFWMRRIPMAVRSGDWKYIQRDDGSEGLYDLIDDPTESTDLGDSHIELRARLRAALTLAAQRVKDEN